MKYYNFISMLAMLLCIYACSDTLEGKEGDHETATPLTREILKGRWTIDLDGQDEYNYASALLDLDDNESKMRLTAINIIEDDLIDHITPVMKWEVVKDYLDKPNESGHREAVRIVTDNGDKILLVDSFDDTHLNLYIPVNNVGKVPFILTRQDADGNNAQPIEIDDLEIERISMSIKDGLIANKDYLSPDKESNSNWMSRVDGRRYLCDLAIPGSHDAATSTVDMLSEFAALTQGLDIAGQWDAGVRAFDLRVRDYNHFDEIPSGVEMCHGPMPCNMDFEEVMKTIIDKVKGSRECAILFINTEDNDLGKVDIGFSIKEATKLLTWNIVSVRDNQLNERVARERVKTVIQKNLPSDMLCYYRPDLTLDEARGKIIILNRLPKTYKSQDLEFIGQGIVKNDKHALVSDNQSKCPDFPDVLFEDDLYFADKDYKDADDFNEKKFKEFSDFKEQAHDQIENGSSNKLFCINPSSSYPDSIYGHYTPLCNYAKAANQLYPRFIEKNKQMRSCGIFRQDYSGVHDIVRVGLEATADLAIATEAIVGQAILLIAPSVAAEVGTIMLTRMSKFLVTTYGDDMVQSVIDMNFQNVSLRKADINKTFIEGKIGHKEKLFITNFAPRDANTDTDVVSWSSNNPDVATIDGDGNLEIKEYGNAIITAKLKNGYETMAYVCCAKTKISAYDLGLSVLWGNRNLGAATPEYMGVPFAWGETEPKVSFTESGYKWYLPDGFKAYSSSDRRRELALEDDAAHVMLGGKWRMPTIAEVEELFDNSTVSATTLNGVNVLKVERAGRTLYLPECPYRNDHEWVWATQPGGYFWTKSIVVNKSTLEASWPQAYIIRTDLTNGSPAGTSNFKRYYGLPIRPVMDR